MKTIFFIVMVVTAASCNNNSSTKTSDQTNDQPSTTKSVALPQGMENIVGEWELVKVIADNNGDHKIDADEDAKATTIIQDYLKLNADGTCQYTSAKLEGRYEITATEDGRKKLVMYDRTGAETNKGRYVLSVTDKELVINRILSGSDFEVFKRL